MAYITKEQVQDKNQKLKLLNKQYGVAARFSGSNSSVLCLKITAGCIDFVSNFVDVLNAGTAPDYTFNKESAIAYVLKTRHISVNHYWFSNSFCGVALEYLEKAYEIMKEGHWDNSNIQIDYFNCSYYLSIQIGSYDKPYKVKEVKKPKTSKKARK